MYKVCHMTSAHPPEDVRIFHKECVSLAKAGYEVYLVEQGDSYIKDNVNIVGMGSLPKCRYDRMTDFAKKVYEKAIELNCDIYHFHDPELLPYGLRLKRKGKIVIFDCHENTIEQIKEKEWIPSILRIPIYWLFGFYQKFVCSRLDGVISVTPHICEYFKTINHDTCMVTNYPILRETEKVQSNLNNSVVFAGGISSQWCHDKIINAIEDIKDCRYVLCGSGEGAYFDSLTSLSGWKKVDYQGRVNHNQVNGIMGSCDIGLAILQYSHNTAFKTGTLGNTKIFEEMMAGLPIICTDFDLWKSFIKKYDCGICVNPNSIEEIRNAIDYLLNHKEESKRMGKNARSAVIEEFNWRTEENKLLEFYDDLIAKSK